MRSILYLAYVSAWISGIVIANGFWSTLFAVLVPFWSWYLVAEALLIRFGIIAS